MARAGGPPGGRGVGDAATGRGRGGCRSGGGVGWGGVGEYRERGRMDGRRDAIRKKEKTKWRKEKKTVRKPQLKMHDHTQKTHAKSNIKTWDKGWRALDCEPEGQSPLSPRSPTFPASHIRHLEWGLGGARRPASLSPSPGFLGSQSRTPRETHTQLKVSHRYRATEVKGKRREESKA